MRFKITMIVSTGLLLISACAPTVETPTVTPLLDEPIPTYSDLPYVSGGTEMQVLDLYLPDNAGGPMPAVLMIHGGGVTKRHEAMRQMADLALDEGYAAVSIEHRIGGPADAPLPLQDAFCALAWVNSNADEYNLDPHRIVAFGHSLSGLFVGNLAVMDDVDPLMVNCPQQLPEAGWLQGAMIFGGTLGAPGGTLGESPFVAQLIGKSYGMETQWVFELAPALLDVPPLDWASSEQLDEEQRTLARLLPPYWVDGGDPPFLLMVGADDEAGIAEEAEAFASVLETAGVSVEVVTLPDTAHEAFSNDAWKTVTSSYLADVFGE